MTDIVTLQAQLEQLRNAYRSGAQSVGYEGKQTTFRDTQGMLAAIAALESEIAKLSGVKPVQSIVVRSTKGW